MGPFSDFPPFARREENLHGEEGEASAAPLADNNLTRGDDNPAAMADNDLDNSVGEEDSEEEKEEIDDEAKVRFFYQSCGSGSGSSISSESGSRIRIRIQSVSRVLMTKN